jgi:hypothetical protein
MVIGWRRKLGIEDLRGWDLRCSNDRFMRVRLNAFDLVFLNEAMHFFFLSLFILLTIRLSAMSMMSRFLELY